MPERGDDHLPDKTELPIADATRLLRFGLSEKARPIDELIDRLLDVDGPTWLDSVLRSGPAGSFGDPMVTLLDGAATLDQLMAVKQTSKSLLTRDANADSRLTALATYFFVVAAALGNHQTNICSRSGHELAEVLLELASVCPEPWREWLDHAASRASIG